MRALTEFNPEFIGLLRPKSGEGIAFACPVCGPSHTVAAYFDNPIDGKESASWQTPKWTREGDSFSDLTIIGSLKYPCFHGWVEDGQVILISESPLYVFLPGIGLTGLSPRQVREWQAHGAAA
jgi:hypothetical protein